MILSILIPLAVAFSVTYTTTPILTKKLVKRRITGIDIHKLAKPVCAKTGGLAVLIGFASGFLTAYILNSNFASMVWAVVLTVVLVACVGIYDDLARIRQRYKPFLVAAAALPLILTYEGDGVLWLPLIGTLRFGHLYPYLIIPLTVTTFANFTNMLAGFNGLEAGIASIALATLGFASFTVQAYGAALLAFILCLAYSGFLRHNWFPARVFPGDVGTLMSGAAIASLGILAKLEFVAILLCVPAAFDFTLKMLSRRPFAQRSLHGDTVVTREGFLKPPPYPSLPHAFMKVSQLGEKRLVGMLLLMEALYAGIAISLTLALHQGYL